MNIMSIEFICYLAGFIDGDGSLIAQIVPSATYVLKFQIRLTVQCSQKATRIEYGNSY